jgi:hypothetical protein
LRPLQSLQRRGCGDGGGGVGQRSRADERVRADPERVLSSYPDVLKATYDRVDELLPQMPPSDWTFNTTATDAATIINELAGSILG